MKPSERVAASALAGVPTGIMSGIANRKNLNSRGLSVANIHEGGARAVPSQIIFWAVVCGGAQWGGNAFMHRDTSPTKVEDSWLRSAWSPLKRLTDEEYLTKMDDKMLGLEADIAIIDDRIAALREKEATEREHS